ncbi:uncharacterized protein I206_106433 [Kwoniella pini CBS 10737]|uniref:BZIP domain-containing protein n=1 Tax=Kwoniella pini CBS 10737 TaxID=1296096 RepID=A0A1B9HUB2_9TREE|nr:uncharacterized protein I206_07237 [Kwoniella pini CBS 10737]OCF46850.1 hypothetical protein I206_07237 [Kwoniella pini CBS 10737]
MTLLPPTDDPYAGSLTGFASHSIASGSDTLPNYQGSSTISEHSNDYSEASQFVPRTSDEAQVDKKKGNTQDEYSMASRTPSTRERRLAQSTTRERRLAQNRAAQKTFREKKEKEQRDLQNSITELKSRNAELEGTLERKHRYVQYLESLLKSQNISFEEQDMSAARTDVSPSRSSLSE